MNEKISFIGAGNMGSALVRSVCAVAGSENVYIYDVFSEKAEALSSETGCKRCKNADEAVFSGNIIFFCVKPQIIKSVLESAAPVLRRSIDAGDEKIAVSIAAGVMIKDIDSVFKSYDLDLPIVRVMPNLAVSVGKGTVLLSAGSRATDSIMSRLKVILKNSGLVEEASETEVAMSTAISGSGPALVYMFIEALADGAVQIGLPRDKATLYAASTVAGAAEMVLKSGIHPGQLKDMVCSPGGTTIEAVAELEKRAFRGAVISAVNAANNKSFI